MTARQSRAAAPLPFTDSQARELGMYLVTLGDAAKWKREMALRYEAARIFGAEHSPAVLMATARACCGRAVELMGGR